MNESNVTIDYFSEENIRLSASLAFKTINLVVLRPSCIY